MKKLLFFFLFATQVLMYAQPNINQPDDIILYEFPFDGFGNFDLTQNEAQTLNGIDPATVTITYYETLADAQTQSFAIANPTNFTNFANPQTIYVNVTELSTNLFSITNFNIEVSDDFVNFPDANFKNRLLEADVTNEIAQDLTGNFFKVDSNSDGEIQPSEALAVSYLNLQTPFFDPASYISNLQGISAFSNLTYLDCSSNNIASIDLSNNTLLTYLNCGVNSSLSSVDISANTNLETLLIKSTEISNLDLSNNINLKELESGNNNQFTGALDLSNNILLERVDCYSMNLTELDVTNNPNLISLTCSNPLQSIDLSNNPNLVEFVCIGNEFTSLDLSNNPNLEVLDLFSNQLSSLDLSNNVNLQSLRCSLGQLTSLDLSNNVALIDLDCVANPMTDINLSNLINLEQLSCNNNQLGVLDLSDNTSLSSLNVSFNLLSSLDISANLNLEDLTARSNLLSNLNLGNNTNLTFLSVDNNLLTSIDMASITNIENLSLRNNQLSNIETSANPNLTNLDLNDNTISAIDVSTNLNLTSLSLGGNPLTEIDVSLLSNLSYLDASNTQISELDLSNNPIGWAICYDNSELTYLNLKNNTISGGEYQVYNVPNLEFVCVDDAEAAFVQGYFNDNGVTANVNSYCSFTPGGDFNTITGSITFDSDNNGCDGNDDAFPYIKININDGIQPGLSFTNNSGIYTFYTLEGDFTVSPDLENPSFFNVTPIDASFNFPDINNNIEFQDFCITANGIHPDVEIVIGPTIPARPGFDAEYLISYKNKGNQTLSGEVSFVYDEAVLDFVASTETPDTVSPGVLNWIYTDLLPFESRSFYVTLNVNGPTETPSVNIDDVLNFSVEVSPIAGDDFPDDNVFNYEQTVVGAFDPNDITCLQGDIAPESSIGEFLHYIIRFENTGNAAAENVVVTTEINANDYNINSLQILNASHDMYVRNNNGVIEFVFENIQLSGGGGHGNILLKIKTKSDLVTDDDVEINADIFFDFNFPITTNTANTLFSNLSVVGFNSELNISIFPNPTASIIFVEADFNIQSITVFDISGRKLLDRKTEANLTSLDLSAFDNGIYFMLIKTDEGQVTKKIIKK